MSLRGFTRLVIIANLLILTQGIAYASAPISDGFDYPVGIPDGTGYSVTLDKGELYPRAGGDKPHLGEDFDINGLDTEFPVYSISNGVVRSAANEGTGWGYCVIIDHKLPDNSIVSSMYAHLKTDSFDTFNIYPGKIVSRGEQIGSIGATSESNGVSWAPHLHLEIRRDSSLGAEHGYAYDSTGWLEPTNLNGDTNGFIDNNRPTIEPLIGDWDNNEIDTTGTFDPHTSIFSLDNGVNQQFGEPGDLPIIGDWTGDGKDSIGIYRPKTAEFHLDYDNNDQSDGNVINFGNIGDIPIVGDWDGDGNDNIGVFRPLDPDTLKTTFFLKYADRVVPIEFGTQNDIPIIGDWNNDGIDDIGVFRRNDMDHQNNAVFYLKNGDQTLNFEYGNNDDIPITGRPYDDKLTRIGVYRSSTKEFLFSQNLLV